MENITLSYNVPQNFLKKILRTEHAFLRCRP